MFTNGQMTGDVVCARLDIINDNVVENNEEFLTVNLSADDPPVTTLTATSATINIRENDNDGNKNKIEGNIQLPMKDIQQALPYYEHQL